MHKKVGTITLEYDRGDGVMVSDAYQAEFNNAKFAGEIQAMGGTFSGKLTASAVNAVKGINFLKGAVAITYLATVASRTVNYNSGVYETSSFRSTITQIPYIVEVVVNVTDPNGGRIRCTCHADRVKNSSGNDRLMEELVMVIENASGQVIKQDGYYLWSDGSMFNKIIAARPRISREYIFEVSEPGQYKIALDVSYSSTRSTPGNFSSTFNNVVLLAEYIKR